MATAGGYELNQVLQASPQKTNFMRLMNLLIRGGTKVVRLLFDSFFPPINLANKLQDGAVFGALKGLKDKRILTNTQWNNLFPPNPLDVTSESFDLSLLVKLLRNICGLTVPAYGWDNLPSSSDTSLEAALATIKYYRNEYSHVSDGMEVDNEDFNDQWDDIKGAILRIIVAKCEKDIDESRTAPLSPIDIDRLRDSLEYSEIVVICNPRIVSSGASCMVIGKANILMANNVPQELMDYFHQTNGVELVDVREGSIKLVLWVKELGALEKFWKRYETGELRKELARILITEELTKFLADGEDVELEVSISEEEYKKAQEQLKAKEEEVLAQELEAKVTIGEKPSQFEIFDGDIFEYSENKFQAHFAVITSENQVEQVLKKVKEKPDVPDATHYIWAYRIFDAHKDDFDEGCNDDKDDDSGAKVLYLLQGTCVKNLIVIVACLYKTSPLDLGPNRLIYIYKSVLELLLIHGVIRLNPKVKTFLKETEYTSFYKGTATTDDPSVIPTFDIKSGVAIKDRKSTFQGHIADVTSREQVPQVLHQLKQNKKIANATYNMWAYRIYDERKKSYLEDKDDDGEDHGGERLLYLLKTSNASNVIVIVTRWHGGIHIGNDRFKHINDCANDLLQQRKLDAKLSTTSADPKEGKKKIRTSKKHK